MLVIEGKIRMSDDGRSARRGVQASTPNVPGRIRLGKQQWQDIRRACKLGATGGLYSVELHGVKVTFKFQHAYNEPGQNKATPRTAQAGHAVDGSTANAQCSPSTPLRPSDAQRPRRGKGKQGSTRAPTPGAYTPAGENVGKASRAPAGLTAEAGSTIAQRPTVCSPRRPNSRQRRSANRLVDFIRAKQASYTATAELPQMATPERASPKRTHEDGVRNSSGVEDAAAASQRRRIVDVDYEARQEAATALYTAWRQHTLATATDTSPKRTLDHGAQEGSAKRGGGQRQLARSWRHQPEW